MDDDTLKPIEEQDTEQTPVDMPEDTPEKPPEANNDGFLNDPEIIAYIDLKVREGIQNALKGDAPKESLLKPWEQGSKEFEKMTYRERLKLFNNDLYTYNKLSRGEI